MKALKRFLARLKSYSTELRDEERLQEEIDQHLALQTEENLRAGLSPDEARRQAVLKFGAVQAIKEEHRDRRRLPLLETLHQNSRYGFRQLRKKPALTATVLLTLALGIGANTAIFTVDYATLLAPLPYPNASQLVMVWSQIRGGRNSISTADFLDWKRENTAFQDLNAQTERSFNIATRDQPENVDGRVTSPGLYRMLGYPFFLGRDFLPEEGQPGNDHVVILTHKFWQRLGSNHHILGTTIRINGEPYTVVGVFAPGLTDRGQGEFSVPLAFRPEQLNRDTRWLDVMGRLKPGVPIKQAQADMEGITARLARNYPTTNKGWSASVESLKNDFIPADRIMTLWLLLGAVGFVLLIACVNVANLLLARSLVLQREMAIRSALGARSATIFGQRLTESLLLAGGGGALGVACGYAMLQGLIAITPPDTLPSEADLRLNLPILLFTIAATTLAGLLSGSAPAWYASRVDAADALKEGGRAGTGAGAHQLRRLLVILEFALALPLLSGAGLAIHSFSNLMRIDLGVRTDHALTFFLAAPDSRPSTPEWTIAYYRKILAGIAAVPGVAHVSVETGTPLLGSGFNPYFSIPGEPGYADPSLRPLASVYAVTPEYFTTFGIRVIRGRAFNDQDNFSSVKVAIVNQDFANRFLKRKDPLATRVSLPQLIPAPVRVGNPIEWQIVGVFHNVRSRGFREDRPEIYVPFWQAPWPSAGVGVRMTGDATATLNSIASAVHAIDPEIALANPRTMEQVRDDVLASDRFTVILFLGFGGIALLLAGVGIYGVMAFSVTQRSHDIALRMALGAPRTHVLGLVLGEGALLACVGTGVGLGGAYFVGRAMQSALFGVGALDFLTFTMVGLVLLITALLASYLPGHRAALLEPMHMLRRE
ncbi:MAG: ABC transporter permease [Acidobacteriaceae bacterium]|nr:ABC transporter permease [Acidobacteriaceae bacterium]